MKNITRILLSMMLVVSVCILSSCTIFDISSMMDDSETQATSSTDKYMTKDEVEKLIEGIEESVTVNAGDNYNINIDSSDNKNLLAASKGLLSAVSIESNFEVTRVYYPSPWGPATNKTETYTSYGSGVIYQIDKNVGSAYIITNYHVVYMNGADTENDISNNIKCYLYGQEYPEYAINAEYIGGSPNYDIAVLRVKNSDALRESKAVAATFADSNDISILDTAIAIGNAEALGISATVGTINVDSEYIVMTNMDETGYLTLRVMRVDAAVNHGNSGGGLFNDKGEVIGIVNAKITDSTVDNIGYAIPSNVAKNVADNIIYYDKLDAKNDSAFRVMIGISVGVKSAGVNYDSETGKIIKYEDVIVETITAGGLAEGNLQINDLIKSVTIDGVDYEVSRTFNVVDIMLTARQNSSVVFHIVRGETAMDINFDMSAATLSAA